MKIVAFPRDENPYQELLYGPLREMGNKITYLRQPTGSVAANALFVTLSLVTKRILGYEIVHIHWTYTFATNSRFMRALSFSYYRFLIWLIGQLRFKLVWTAHNVLPHEMVFDDDRLARECLVRKADLVIFHNPSAVDDLQNLGIHAKRHVVIPHGNYVGYYENVTSRDVARGYLRVPPSSFVYLQIGFLRPYKGTDELIDAFRRLPHGWDVVLVIAGKCVDSSLRKRIAKAAEQSQQRILFREGFIPDEDVQHYYAASNAVVLPYRRVTTSGSAVLALSFERPIIVPDVGSLASLPEQVTLTYEPTEADGLKGALERAYLSRRRLDSWPKSAADFVEGVSWPAIAAQTDRAFRGLLG